MKMFGKFLCLSAMLFAAGSIAAGEIQIKDGESLAFLGDSITSLGWNNQYGYVHLVIEGLKAEGINVKPIPAGVSGNKSIQMNARMERDVVAKKATWMAFNCGVNDVWHGKNGVPIEQYKKEVNSIFDKADKAGVKVVILTPTMIREDQKNPENQKLIPYVEFLKAAAKERKYLIADLNGDMQKTIADAKAKDPKRKGNLLTSDGVHMNPAGDELMATGMLVAFGMDAAQLENVRKAWKKIPDAKTFGRVGFSYEEAEQIEAAAKKAKVSPAVFIHNAALDAAKK